MDLEAIREQSQKAVETLLLEAKLSEGQIVVVGCSTSEVMGRKIGSASNQEAAQAIMDGLLKSIRGKKLFLAVQCCEHLNRALVVENQCKDKYNLEEVAVIPHLKAGGALAAEAMTRFTEPVVVEKISGHTALDIGDTLIGMHLRRVAVPVRLPVKNIGKARVNGAQTRPPLIGGERARYS